MSNLVILFTTLFLNFVSALGFSRHKTTAREKYKVYQVDLLVLNVIFLFTYSDSASSFQYYLTDEISVL